MREKKLVSKRRWADADDAPALGAAFFDRATIFDGDRVVRRGRGRPAGSGTKIAIALRVDRDIVEAFKADGKGWQGRINETLRGVLTRQGKIRRQSRGVTAAPPNSSPRASARPSRRGP